MAAVATSRRGDGSLRMAASSHTVIGVMLTVRVRVGGVGRGPPSQRRSLAAATWATSCQDPSVPGGGRLGVAQTAHGARLAITSSLVVERAYHAVVGGTT